MLKLYYYPGNANLAPHILLEELGAKYELVLVDRNKNAHKAPEYLKLNPTGRIPVLTDGDLVLFETAAICLHLVDTHASAGFAPKPGTAERAQFYKWLIYLTNTLQAELIIYFYPDRLTGDESMAAVVKAHAEERIGGMLDIIEATLAEHAVAGRWPFLLGAQYSAVDPYLLMLCRWTRGLGKPARARPHLAKYLAMMVERPAVKRAFEMEGLTGILY